MYDLLLKGAHVVDPLNGVNGVNDVAVEGGKVAAVGPDLTGPVREVIDVSGWVLQPGIIDSHVHLGSMWGSPYGPRMLAMNGVTTCLDMAGPLDDILEKTPQYGAGLNTAILQFASPPFTFKNQCALQGGNGGADRQVARRGSARGEAFGRPLSADARSLLHAH